MRILITGARGFVGRSIAEAAHRRKWVVCGIGRSSQAPTDWPGSYIWSDVAQSDLYPMVQGFSPDVIFHGAGAASVGNSMLAPLDDLRASVMTFASVLEAARRSANRPVVIFPSSAAVYGEPLNLPVREDALTVPISPYGFHKLQCELLAREYSTCFGLNIVVCRLFSIFGPHQRRLLVWELYEQIMSDSAVIQLQGTGDETRDYLYSDDAAERMLDLGVASHSESLTTVNVASGVETKIAELAEEIKGILGCQKPIVPSSTMRSGDPRRWHADTALLQTKIPKLSTTSLTKALELTVDSWKSRRK